MLYKIKRKNLTTQVQIKSCFNVGHLLEHDTFSPTVAIYILEDLDLVFHAFLRFFLVRMYKEAFVRLNNGTFQLQNEGPS